MAVCPTYPRLLELPNSSLTIKLVSRVDYVSCLNYQSFNNHITITHKLWK